MDRITNERKPGHAALRRGRASLPHHTYHVTISTLRRRRAFDDFEAARSAAIALTSAESLGDASLLAWVLMPDHGHLLLQLGDRDPLPLVVSRVKARMAAAVNRAVGTRGALWSRAYHDRALRCEDDLPTIARYIVANPVRAGLVRRHGDYPFWNAIWL